MKELDMVKLLVNWIHLSAAMVWIGAVFTGALVMLNDVRTNEDRAAPLRTAAYYTALSPFAWGSLALLALTGSVKAGAHLEGGVAGLFTTPWGRLLSVKLLVAGVMVACGAYATYVISPQLRRTTENAIATRRRQRSEIARLERRLRAAALTAAALGLVLLLIVTLL